jgi:hypothetical protein
MSGVGRLVSISACAALLSVVVVVGGALSMVAADEADEGVLSGPPGPLWEEPADEWIAPGWEEPDCEAYGVPRDWLSHWFPWRRGRHIGWGQPLEGTSWLNRPMYVGGFVGPWMGDTLVNGRVNQEHGTFSGVWLGRDGGHYWGYELRVSLLYVDTYYEPERRLGDRSRNVIGDVNLLYYPWGDARWRPYASLGVGLASFHFVDELDRAVSHTGVSLPLGLGLKYQLRRSLAFRLDWKNNLVFGGHGIETTHNWSVTGGFEWHWGDGSSVSYDPW